MTVATTQPPIPCPPCLPAGLLAWPACPQDLVKFIQARSGEGGIVYARLRWGPVLAASGTGDFRAARSNL